MKRAIKSFSVLLLILLMSTFILGIILFYTHIGLRMIVATTNFFFNDHGITVKDENIKGTLSNFYLSELKIDDQDGTQVIIKGVKVKWYPQLLITGIFNVKSVYADHVTVIVNTNDDDNNNHSDDDSYSDNSMNWPVHSNDIFVKSAEIHVDNHTSVHISNFHSKAKLVNQYLDIIDANFYYDDVPTQAQSLNGKLNINYPYRLKANLVAKPDFNNTNLIITASVDAPLNNHFAANITANGKVYAQDVFARAYLFASPNNVSLSINQFNSTLGLGKANIQYNPKNDKIRSDLFLNIVKHTHPSQLDTVQLTSIADLTDVFELRKDTKSSVSFTHCRLIVNQYEQACEFDLEQDKGDIYLSNLLIGDQNQFIKANGKLYPLFDFSWQAHIQDINRFLPNYKGELITNGYLYGSVDNPGLSSLFELNQFFYNNNKFGDITAKIALNNNLLDSTLQIKMPQGVLADFHITGVKKDQIWSYDISNSHIYSKEYGNWSVSQSKPITFNSNKRKLDIPETCFLSGSQNFCSYLFVSPALLKTSLNANINPTPYLKSFLPQLNANNSILNLRLYYLDYKWLPKWFIVQSKLTPMKIQLNSLSSAFVESIHYASINEATLAYNQFNTSATLTANTSLNHSNMDLDLNLSNLTTLNNLNDASINGSFNADIDDLSIFNYFVNYPMSFGGEFTSHLKFDGTLSSPSITGSAVIKNGNVQLYNYNSKLNDINIQAEGKNYRWVVTGKGYSNNKPLTLNATVNWEKEIKLQSQLQGSQIDVVNIPPLELTISPDLKLVYDNQLQLTGVIKVDHAKVQGDDLPNLSNTNQMQNDIVYIDDENEPVAVNTKIPLDLDLDIDLGDDTKFYGFGLQSYFTGNLKIKAQSHQNAIGVGKIYLKDAVYTFYNKQFHIADTSLVTYTNSSLENPYLNITANYQIPAQQQLSPNAPDSISAHVLGTAQNPNITFFSTPPMSQANILSYIILGQTLDNSDNFSKDQQQQLSSAALALALNGGSAVILQDVQNKFGITDISFGTIQQGQVLTDQLQPASAGSTQAGNQNNTALFIGKALSPHLYLNYGVGIFTGEQLVQAIYRLNKNWRLQADYTNLDTGADLIYQFSVE